MSFFSAPSAGELSWAASTAAVGLRVSHGGARVTCDDSSDGWHAVRTRERFASGRHYIEFVFHVDGPTSNTWRTVVGAVPSSFKCQAKSFTCVGSGQGGWGYVSATGNKYCKKHGPASDYGLAFSQGDVVGMLLDFTTRQVSFYHNGTHMGVAFSDLQGPVHAAASITAKHTCIEVRRGVLPVPVAMPPTVPAVAPPFVPRVPSGPPDESMSEEKQIQHLEREFGQKLGFQQPNLAAKFWSDPLSELAAMGFRQAQGLEALLVTGSGNSLSVQEAVEYLFADKATRVTRYLQECTADKKITHPGLGFTPVTPSAPAPSAPSAPFQPFGQPQTDEVALLRMQLVQAQAELSAQRERSRQLEMDAYTATLHAIITDESVNRQEEQHLVDAQVKYSISHSQHLAALAALGVTTERYEAMQRRGREQEEQLRKLLAAKGNPDRALKPEEECVVCLSNVKENIILDCMHLCLCDECKPSFVKDGAECPVCRREIKEIRKTY